jgi:hypothetical protein
MRGDPVWMQDFLMVHIAAGSLSLVLAPIALSLTKGSTWHKRWGKVYFLCIGLVAATALPMALYRPVLFLALVAILSFYLAFSGYRVLRLKSLARGGSASLIDWLAAVLTFAGCACLAGFAVLRPGWVQNMGVVAILLGTLGMRGTLADMIRFVRKPTNRMFWLTVHLEKFIGSYIATCTAFSVVTLSQVFPQAGLAIWLWPSVIGTPAIIASTIYYKRKFEGADVGAAVSGRAGTIDRTVLR